MYFSFENINLFALCNQIINKEHGKIDLNIYNQNLQNLIDLLLKKNIKKDLILNKYVK